MKPNFHTANQNQPERASDRPFPVTDFNYHSVSLDGCNSHCARIVSPSFHSLSRDYLKTEANRNFLVETVVFGAIMATALLPIVNGIRAVIGLVGVNGLF